jgi:hypothetical protein
MSKFVPVWACPKCGNRVGEVLSKDPPVCAADKGHGPRRTPVEMIPYDDYLALKEER